MKRIFPAWVALVVFLASDLCASPTVFKQKSNYWEEIDTNLRSDLPDQSRGGWGESLVSCRPTQQMLVAFSSLIENTRIPAGSEIFKARLRLYCNACTGSPAIVVHRLLIPWNEVNTTWDSFTNGVQCDDGEAVAKPTAQAKVQGCGWIEWDVTADVQAWSDGSGTNNYGWALLAKSPDGSASFITKDNAQEVSFWPELVVDFTPAPLARGARLSDEALFQSLNLSLPGLQSVKTAALAHDWKRANHYLAEYFRHRPPPACFGGATAPAIGTNRLPANSTAEKALANTFSFVGVTATLPAPMDWRSLPTKASSEWQVELSRHSWFTDLNQAWLQTGNSIYATGLVNQVHWFIQQMPPPALDLSGTPAWVSGPPRTGWRTIDVGFRMGWYWPDCFVSMAKCPCVADDDLVDWVKSFVEQARFLMRYHSVGNNWMSFETCGLYTAGVLFPEFYEAPAWRVTAVSRMEYELDGNCVYPDGAEKELTPWYHAGFMRYATRIAKLALDNGYPLPPNYHSALERMYDYLLQIAEPNWQVPMLNDSDPMEVRSWFLSATNVDGTLLFNDRSDFDWIFHDRAAGAPPTNTSRVLPYAGQAVMRSDWTKQARYLLFEGGPYGIAHAHEDKLGIYVAAYGCEFIVDSGRFLYDSKNPLRIYVLNARAHSTVELDGKLQQRGSSPATWSVSRPDTMNWRSTPRYEYASAAYGESTNELFYTVAPFANAHGGMQISDPEAAQHRRHVLFLKPNYWIILDDLTPFDTAAHTWRAYYQLTDMPYQLNPENASVVLQHSNTPSFTLTALNEGGLKVDVIRGAGDTSASGAAHLLGWQTDGTGSQKPIPVARFTRTATGRQQIACVLYPSPAGVDPVIPTLSRLSSPTNLFALCVIVSGHSTNEVVLNLAYPAPFEWAGVEYSNERLLVLGDCEVLGSGAGPNGGKKQ